MLFLYSQDTGIASTLSHPRREVFALAARIAIDILSGLGKTYPQEQAKCLKLDNAALQSHNHRLSAITNCQLRHSPLRLLSVPGRCLRPRRKL